MEPGVKVEVCLRMAELVRRALGTYVAHPREFVSVALVLVVFDGALALAGDRWTWAQLLLSVAAGYFVAAALTHAAAEVARGHQPGIIASYRAVWRHATSLGGVLVLAEAAPVVAAMTVVGIPVAIWLYVRWFFGIQGVVIRGLGAREALQFSALVIAGMWWRVFGLVLGLSIIIGSIAAASWWGPALLPWEAGVDRALLSVLLRATVLPVIVCFETLLFLRLCERRGIGAEASRT